MKIHSVKQARALLAQVGWVLTKRSAAWHFEQRTLPGTGKELVFRSKQLFSTTDENRLDRCLFVNNGKVGTELRSLKNEYWNLGAFLKSHRRVDYMTIIHKRKSKFFPIGDEA